MKHTSETVQAWLGYLYVEELEALRQLAAELPEGAAVANIGAGGGTSGLVFMESPNNLRLFTVDKQKDASPTGCLAGEEAVFRSAGFWGDPRHKQIHGDSTEIGLIGHGKDRYDIRIGGALDGTRLNTTYIESVRSTLIAETLRPLVAAWAAERTSGESFGDFSDRWLSHAAQLQEAVR